jgi:hypothetical protein
VHYAMSLCCLESECGIDASGYAMVLTCVRSTVMFRSPYAMMSLSVNLVRPDGMMTVVCACLRETGLLGLHVLVECMVFVRVYVNELEGVFS